MARFLLVPLLALGLLAAGCGKPAAPAPQPGEPTNTPSTEPTGIPVAPMPRLVTHRPTPAPGAGDTEIAPAPHRPGEKVAPPPVGPFPNPTFPEPDLTDPDIGIEPLDVVIPEIDLITQKRGAGQLIADVLGVPDPSAVEVAPPSGINPGSVDVPPVGALPAAPGGFGGRSSATKVRLVEPVKHADSEKAIAIGLEWLAKQQKGDGSWEFDGSGEFKTERACATAMALLPFLRAGESHKPDKDGKKTKYQKTVEAALNYLKKACPTSGVNAGKVTANMYAQAIITLALVEAYATTKDATLRPYAQAAVNFVQKSQGPDGSWGYQPTESGDTSITGWQLQALFAAKQVKDLAVNDQVIKKALAFLDAVAGGKQKEMYGYRDAAAARAGTALTASALLARFTLGGWGPQHPGLAAGVQGLVKNPPTPAKAQLSNIYYYYYATHVVRYHEGDEWATWNEGTKDGTGTRKGGMRDWLIKTQVTKNGPSYGSWDPDDAHIGRYCGRLGTTSFAVLTLQVQFRPVPQLYKPKQ